MKRVLLQYNQALMNQAPEKQQSHPEITAHVFANSPTMLALCLTMVGLIKIYTALQKVTTLADNILAFCLAAFLFATLFSYLALRYHLSPRRSIFARIADAMFLSGLSACTLVAFIVVYSLAG
ncbi:MAG TPA: hypothetical protein VN633_09935 [Bryobacteraceae bacterium]|nr:hypothetical protein [Bryobacteraceae bacterium]